MWRSGSHTTTTVAALILLAGCEAAEEPLFEAVPAERSGVTFVNELPESPAINIINYLNYYNGGGVAAGDVDGDGLPDLYFTSNLGADRLYRNLGGFRFEDVTERAGLGDARGWKSGVAMADVNGDGHLDIHVSTVTHLNLRGRNVLYVNDGDGTFTDRTAEYGLEHVGYSTQAAFFDYDGDGDLDVYLLNHSTHAERGRPWRPERETRHPRAGDLLYRNDGTRFVDVSQASGIFGTVQGYGLGVVVSDLNLDGCPDIFVANDFDESDFLYVNNCDGTFTESLAAAMGHTSRSSMGVDAADFDNDGRPDVFVLDMLPERQEILTTSANAEDVTIYSMKLAAGYHPQFPWNTLQLNRGQGRFSEIGQLAGVWATDWSWTPLFADLDNDGLKDLFVTNGIHRRPNDMDYITHVADRELQMALQDSLTPELLASLLAKMPQVPLPNYAYRNNGDLTFTDMARGWGLARPGFSTGAVYVDLDGDGALDLVTSDVNAPAAIYRNRARAVNGHHYLAIRLQGSGKNTAGLGSKVVAYHDGAMQLLEQMPTRGFQSSVEPRLHFGLGSSGRVDSLLVVWPDRRFQVLREVAVDRLLTLVQDEATGRFDYGQWPPGARAPARFEPLTTTLGVDYTHAENTFFDYNREPLIPHKISTEGPALAVADVNGDGRDDLYVGGAKWQAGQLWVQRADGTFGRTNGSVFQPDSLSEDVDAVFFDANGDGHRDLYVVSAGNEFWGEQEPLRDRLYVNDGQGGFRRDREALPAFFDNGSCVVPGDFDGDGDADLFVGGRVVSRRYGDTPRSYLLENDGTGRFRDVTAERAPDLAAAGMVTAAAWADVDGDGALDLIVVGEWMPVRIFRQERGGFADRTAQAGLAHTHGWWNTVAVADLDGSGRPSLVLGNLGLNSSIRASRREPARLYLYDFAHNGGLLQILTVYRNGVSYPLAGRDELVRVIPQLRDRYPTYAAFGASRIEDILPRADLRKAEVREAYLMASAVARNRGEGSFDLHPLPIEAQFAPIYAALPGDFDGDGHTDVVVAGNFLGVPPVRGRYDAGYGALLRGDGSGGLTSVDLASSGLVLDGEVRALALLRAAGGGRLLVAARNAAPLQFFRVR